MVAKTTNFLPYLLFVVRVVFFERGFTFPHILTPTPLEGGQIDYPITITVNILLDFVNFLSICGLKCIAFLHNWARNPAVVAFRAPAIWGYASPPRPTLVSANKLL